jgi:hypothetical protein
MALLQRELVRQPGVLVVAGSLGSGGLFSRMLGSTASQLLLAVDGVIMLVPDRRREGV